MSIVSFCQSAWKKAGSFLEPAPVKWEDFSRALAEPEEWLGERFVTTFQTFAAQPEHQAQLASMDARSNGHDHVFAEVKPNGIVNVIVRQGTMETITWQSKPDGSTHRGLGFRALQQGYGAEKTNQLIAQCFDDVAADPHFAGAVALARDSYKRDVSIFKRDPGGLDNLAYKNA